jgi:hypothetical protein
MTRVVTDRRVLKGLPKSREVEAVLLKAAQIGARGASRRAPVGDPPVHLRDSYEAESEPGEARFGSNLKYAEHVENGTINAPAQPHVRPAVDDIKGAIR